MARRKPVAEDSDNTERWMVSYADFVTLLFAFFVVMYAISSVNEGKYRVLSDTLTEAFKVAPKSPEPIQVGKVSTVIKEQEGRGEAVVKPVQILPKPVYSYEKEMKQVADTISEAMKPLIEQGLIKVKQDKLWVEIEMNTKTLFASASSEVEDEALPALRKLALVLKKIPNSIDVEGHTDNLPIRNEIFLSNWELSAARAASVVHLFTKLGVDPVRMSSIGYGEYRPVAPNSTSEGRLQNRRVKVVILATKNSRRIAEINRTNSAANESEEDTGGGNGQEGVLSNENSNRQAEGIQ